MRKTQQSGFTLIELVVVITILGILAAIALPRFANLQTEARIAKMNGALGSLKAAAALAHSLQLSQQKSATATIDMEGTGNVTLVNGYPDAATIATAAGISSPDYEISTTATVLTVTPDTGHANCKITYTAAAAANTQPTYDNTALTAANCQ